MQRIPNARPSLAPAARTLSKDEHDRFLPIVRRIAMRMARRVPSEVTVEDLVSYGWIGLLEAFSRSAGMPDGEFEAYASYRVRGAMLDYLRSLDPMARTTRALSRRINRAVTQTTNELGRVPDEREVAKALDMKVDEYRASMQRISDAGAVCANIENLDDLQSHTEMPDELAGREMLKKTVMSAIGELPERLQQVLALYYQEGCTLLEIGQVLGVTEARACQLHGDAMKRLRAAVRR
jgi:RNA polymerase sigma factor for flagellar operon FliA